MSIVDKLKSYSWRPSTWSKLFQQDELFTELKALSSEQLPQAIQLIESCQQTLPSRLPDDRWLVAQSVLTCAQLAALDHYEHPSLSTLLIRLDPHISSIEPPTNLDTQSWPDYLRSALKNATWPPPLSSAWAWDAVTCFWKRQRKAASSQQIAILLLDENDQGLTAELSLDLLEDGDGTLYPEPERMSFVRLGVSFTQALRTATNLAQNKQLWPSDKDVRWCIQRQDGAPLTALDGGSAGGAYALGLFKLLADASG